MLNLDYILICEDVIVDSSSRISAIKIFDSINVSKLPVAYNRFNVLFRLSPSRPITKILRIKLAFKVKGPDGQLLASAENEVKDISVAKGSGIVSSIDLSQTVFKKAGVHKVQLLVDGKLIGVREFKVNQNAKQSDK